MPSIVRYQKHITREITRELQVPEGSTELCLIDGWTYVSLPDGAALDAEQPAEIAGSITPVELDVELRAMICQASPHVQLINDRVRERIAAVYPIHEEIKLLRTAPSAEFEAYNEYAESCRQWGRERKAELGL